jgi:glycosyltransferase involved in cell wall biosynthesis
MALRFSIVIPTLDRREMLGEALASVRAQQSPDTEVIVVDGGSTDGTIEELRRQPDIRLVAGPDRGVYDAFNKGIACATGDIVGILNSDDCYEPGTFAAVAGAFGPRIQAVCGTSLIVADGHVTGTLDDEAAKSLASPRITLIGSCTPNARFFRRESMMRVGPFSLDYRFVSDRDWLTRWYEAGLSTATIPNVVYRYRQHAGSMTFDADRRHEWPIREELLRLARRWRNDVGASAETRRIAGFLEGRCVAMLAASALRNGQIVEFGRWLFERDGRRSITPLISVIRGGVDWAGQTLRSPKSYAPSGKTKITPA